MRRSVIVLAYCLLFASASPWATALAGRNLQAAVPPKVEKPPVVPPAVNLAQSPSYVQAPVPIDAEMVTPVELRAQPKTSPSPPKIEALVPVKAAVPVPITPKAIPQTVPPAEANSSAVQQSNDAYNVWVNGFRERTYENQLFQTRVIFSLVILLVFAGLFFSWIQFQHAFHLKRVLSKRVAAPSDEATAAAPAQDEVSFGKDGVVIKSAYLGVIILAISMAFFFLYLVYVYPIT
jgi:hypothetical protein